MQIIPKKTIPVTIPLDKSNESSWQSELANAYTDPASLLNYLQLNPEDYAQHFAARRLFNMRVPRPFAKLMQTNKWDDPLLKQVFPAKEEFQSHPDFVGDPLQEHNNALPGILHKYQNRALFIVKGGCAVNCRYCFRRSFPYEENAVSKAKWRDVLNYVAKTDALDEVIFSGGDPLMAKDSHLAWLAEQISQIPHIKRLRIHTRFPVVIPQRINDEFLSWFAKVKLQKIMVFHINHANEVSPDLKSACAKLRGAGVHLLNQAVLLRGINDSVQEQIALNEAVFEAGILPYYLHLLDKVEGASHFDTPQDKAKQIMAEVIKRQPGYLVPKLVREIAGQPGKTPIDLTLHP
uniref:EF-P beta-lysylation protein EpmB n=1 Tax=Ningiella ruwaisensis TaxID=2364274 RepID=UPI00109FD7AA|nr:EF-P beta-lysylation protein EpmB [Ningiella ruwaisensis]